MKPERFKRAGIFFAGVLAGVSLMILAFAFQEKVFWKEASIPPAVEFNAPPSFAPIAEKVNPAVVTVYTTKVYKSPFEFGSGRFFFFFGPGPYKEQGMGSGFIISPDGYIVTNYHVIKDADEIKVAVGLKNKEKYEAKKIGWDEKTDIALIKINAHNLPTVVLGDSDQVKVGDWVVAIGSPFEFPHTLTAGIVSAKGRRLGGPYDDFIQTDASINPGNSGGPLVNMRGEVIGINTMIISPGLSGGNVGIGFAIPINLVKALLPQLKEKGRVIRAWLGVYIQEVTPELAQSFGLKSAKGALVSQVVKGSPAEKAGIKAGDIILEFDGKEVEDWNDLPLMVSMRKPGERVRVKIYRDGKVLDLWVTLAKMPGEERMARAQLPEKANLLGIEVTDLTPEKAHELGYEGVEGALVVFVSPDSPLAGKVLPDDLILQINRHNIKSANDFYQVVKRLKPGQLVRIYLRRGSSSMFYAFRLPRK